MFPDLVSDDIFRLETARLWLRWPCAGDAEAMVRYAGAAEVSKFTGNIPFPYTQAHAGDFILSCRRANASGEQIGLALTRKGHADRLIGMVGLHRHEAEDGMREALLGYWLGQPFWGQGLMREAVQALVDLGFHAAGLDRIRADVRLENSASHSLLARLGFERGAQRPVYMAMRGGTFPCQPYVACREDWLERQARQRRQHRGIQPREIHPAA